MSDEDIEDYEAEYRGSDQEAAELLELYTQHEGNMDTVSTLCCVMSAACNKWCQAADKHLPLHYMLTVWLGAASVRQIW